MITAIYVVLMAVFYIGYTWYLILLKRHAITRKVDWPMRWYDRASHGRDFVAQYTPPALLLLGIVELGGAGALILHGLGLLLVAGALLHVRSFGFPAHMRTGMVAMVLVTAMYGLAGLIALAQLAGLTNASEGVSALSWKAGQ
jgi:uncharacterized membrane protein YecN with MAPEG domain